MSKKDLYIDKASAKLDEYGAQLSQLKAKIRGEVADQKIDLHNELNDGIKVIELKMSAAKTKLEELADAAEDQWEDISEQLEKSAKELGQAIRKLFS